MPAYKTPEEEAIARAVARLAPANGIAGMQPNPESIEPRNPTFGERIHDFALDKTGSRYAAEKLADVAGFVPGLSGAGAVHDAAVLSDRGDYIGAGLNAAGAAAGSVPGASKMLGMFGGVLARRAPLDTLELYQKLLKDGADNEYLIKHTGWFRGVDGQPRFAIDPKGSKVNSSSSLNVSLGDIYDHPNLYDNYPGMKGMPVRLMPDLRGSLGGSLRVDRSAAGNINAHPGEMRVSSEIIGWPYNKVKWANKAERPVIANRPKSDFELKYLPRRNVLDHELGHGIQQIEGFSPGGSPYVMRSLVKSHGLARGLSAEHGDGIIPTIAFRAYESLPGEAEARAVSGWTGSAATRGMESTPRPWLYEDTPRNKMATSTQEFMSKMSPEDLRQIILDAAKYFPEK